MWLDLECIAGLIWIAWVFFFFFPKASAVIQARKVTGKRAYFFKTFPRVRMTR